MLQVLVMVQMAEVDQVVVLLVSPVVQVLQDTITFYGSGNTPPVSPPQGNNGAPSALGNPFPGYNAQGGGAGNAGTII